MKILVKLQCNVYITSALKKERRQRLLRAGRPGPHAVSQALLTHGQFDPCPDPQWLANQTLGRDAPLALPFLNICE
jgi:hypothetical protein